MPLPPGFPVAPSRISLTQINVFIKTFVKRVATKGWFGGVIGLTLELFVTEWFLAFLNHTATFITGGVTLWWVDTHKDTAAKWIKDIADHITAETPLATDLSAITLNQITGLNLRTDAIKHSLELGDIPTSQLLMGREFGKVVDNMLRVSDAQRDFQNRTSHDGSFDNLAAYFGTNLDFQLRSLTIGTISSIFGIESLKHLEGLHQSINWAFGFGWLSWSVLSNAMDVTVNQGIKRYYLSQVKPHDLSVSQANKALIRKMITPEIWNQIHSNAGDRDDMREWQLQLEFKQPSLSEIKTAYKHEEITPGQIDDLLIQHEFTPQGAEMAKSEIMNAEKWRQEDAVAAEHLRHLQRGWETKDQTQARLQQLKWDSAAIPLALEAHSTERIFHLREAVTREHMKFLRHGWETQEEARTWLASQGWSEEEIALAFEANRLEQKADKKLRPRVLTAGEIAAFVSTGFWSTSLGQSYLVSIGYDAQDANYLLGFAILQHAISITPKKVRDACETENHLSNLLTSALTAAEVLDPLSIIKQSDYFRLIQCYVSQLTASDGGSSPPPVTLPPTPQALTVLPTSGGATLSWQPIAGLADYQAYRRQIGDSYFIPVGPSSTATTYSDTGLRQGEIYIYVVRAKVNGVESADSNAVQITAI